MMKPFSNDLCNDAAIRIKWCLVVLNAVVVILGIIEVCLGSALCYYLAESSTDDVPQLWMIGVPQVIIGAIGIASLLHAQKTTILAWLVTSSLMLPLSFILFTQTDCFNSAIFWVHLQVFGQCTTYPHICKCFWDTTSKQSVHTGSCEDIRYTTSLYLCVIGLLIISLVLIMVVIGLGYIMTLCIRFCIPKELRPIYTSCSTANGLEASAFYRSSKVETPPMGKCNLLTVPLVEMESNSTASDRTLLS